ncbi:transcriptional regulator containing an amidase domain and an AraC-type DNA-binding HTH domain [Acidovorax sp. CF316]|uniref:GlxA family transcriptional regulator n=1 Tax=Acidovorax sp. CF316 TaxID=1144317 RepID=UPI00026BEDA6|nr:helix-turn-helix domain-containing protein [Acidovorax sp. CF316]EJE50839.1 transcriptional regulator containing an amidase domain and an AraC-type DNA-binding HTH domain [Acidovorax sp. CF316]
MPTIPFRIDIPLVPESALGNALHFIDLLRSANLLARLRLGNQAPRMDWRLLDADGRPLPTAPAPWSHYTTAMPSTEGPPGSAQAVFIPSFLAADIPAIRQVVARHPALVRQVGIAVDAGQKLLTMGDGAWLAAASGRLQGRTASLPWFYMAGFARDFPGIALVPGRDWTDDGPWLSGALPHNLVDLAIALVRHAFGEELARAFATVMAPDHQRAQAALQANAQQHIPATRDSTLARAIAWMEAHLEEPYSLERLAQAASVSTRTLLRHFQAELAQSPLDYLHALRCARAKVMLEVTLESVSSIAVACGYADPAAFRRIFVRHVGTPPAEYRKRHALRAPRRRWRVEVAGG